MASVAGETASSTHDIFQTFLSNCWTYEHQNKVSYLLLNCLGMVHDGFMKKGHQNLVKTLIFSLKDSIKNLPFIEMTP